MVFHLGEQLLRLLDTQPRLPADVQSHLPGVNGGKEILPQQRHQGQRERHERNEEHNENSAVREHVVERMSIRLPETLESMLNPVVRAPQRSTAPRPARRLICKQVVHHRRHQRAREEVRRQHCEDDRHGERDEERLRRSGDECHGKEDDADANRRDERGHRNLRCSVEDRADDGLARRALTMKVLDCDGCVVNEDAHRERHATERHQI